MLTQGQALPLEGDDPAQPGPALYQELVTGHEWLNKLAQVCQCCTQGKDAARPEDKRRCCAIGQCCHAALSARSRADARDTLRAALTCAVEEEIITRNPVAVVRLPAPRTRKRRWWTVDEGRQFLESSRRNQEPLYAAFVLILVLGLRKGEVLGLTWELVNLDDAELYVSEQVQRVGNELLRRPGGLPPAGRLLRDGRLIPDLPLFSRSRCSADAAPVRPDARAPGFLARHDQPSPS